MTSRKKSHRSKKGIFKRGLKTFQTTTNRIIPGVKHSIEHLGKNITGYIPSTKSNFRSLMGFKPKTKKRRSKKSRKR